MQKAIYRNYQASIREIGRTGTWLPGDIVRIGDVGRLEKGRFVRHKTLSELGIDFEVEDGGEPSDVFKRASANQRSGAASASVEGVADGDLSFEFNKRGQFVLSAKNLLHRRTSNIGHVCDQIVRFYRLNKWKAGWILIDQVWTAEYLTVFVSESKSAALTFRAKTGELPGIEVLSNPEVDVGVHRQIGKIFEERGANKTPFFTGRRIKWRLFRDNETEQISTRGSDGDELDVFELAFDDLMESWADSNEA